MSNNLSYTEKLAIDGGEPVIARRLNHYKGAAVIGEEEKRAVMEALYAAARVQQWVTPQ